MQAAMRYSNILALSAVAALCVAAPAAPSSFVAAAPSTPRAPMHHRADVSLDPDRHTLRVTDEITLSGEALSDAPLVLTLHAGLAPTCLTPGARLTLLTSEPDPHIGINDGGEDGETAPGERYAVTLVAGMRSFALRYGGVIHHPPAQEGAEHDRSFGTSAGVIASEGVYLAGASRWLAALDDGLFTFDLSVTAPAGWDVMSQGSRRTHELSARGSRVRYVVDVPQDEAYLIAARFATYEAPPDKVAVQAFLRTPDAALAESFLAATRQYLGLYEGLLGPYAYDKFALVENFWETGYGMPSFTLLGPKIIRFPFILTSSYPHEILHNWWGNGVLVDYAKGNWCEGLTAYLADHLLKEQAGKGAEYRRAALQKYGDYVAEKRDFPVLDFRARRSVATQAVGYDKVMMVMHMLRLELDDERFVAGLRRFYRERLFTRASFTDLTNALSAEAGHDVSASVEQWTTRPGAVMLRLIGAKATPRGARFHVSATLEQVQPGIPYRVEVPVAVTLAKAERAVQARVRLDGARATLELDVDSEPLRLDVDPEYDVFRRLDLDETPPALSGAFGAKQAVAVLPGSAPPIVGDAFGALVKNWQTPETALDITADTALRTLPRGKAIWLFGWDNRFRDVVARAAARLDVQVSATRVRFGKTELTHESAAVVIAVRNPEDATSVIVWVASNNAKAIAGLGRKLPHYGKYGWLAFSGDEPENLDKEVWPAESKALVALLRPNAAAGPRPARATLAQRVALAELPLPFAAQRLRADVAFLASKELAGRGPEAACSADAAMKRVPAASDSSQKEPAPSGLTRTREWVVEQMRAAGLAPGGEGGTSYLEWVAESEPMHDTVGGVAPTTATRSTPPQLANVVGVLEGSDPELARAPVVVGAHYDHLGLGGGHSDIHRGDEGKLHPGADDNASGVAVLLELARVLVREGNKPKRSIVFVAFTSEEQGRRGSRFFVADATQPGRRAFAMLNLDTVGRLGTGKLLALGTGGAREWPHIFMGAGYVTSVDIRTVASDPGGSDQVSFAEVGVPAVQLTTGPHSDYHRPSDTADKVDTSGLIKVASVAREAVLYLAGRSEPLHGDLPGASAASETERSAGAGPRAVTLGVIPDFAYSGEGVRLGGATPGSAAEAAGLASGDVLVQLGGQAITSLRGLSEALKSMAPGQRVTVVFKRGEVRHEATVALTAR